MNKNLFFLIFATGVTVLSIICINIAPIISNVLDRFGLENCQLVKDNYDYYRFLSFADDDISKMLKKELNFCYKHNAMHDLEYTSFIIDIVLGFICAFLGIFHYLEVGKNIEKYTGLIGIISGIIITVITLIYTGYSADIFSNEIAFKPKIKDIFDLMTGKLNQETFGFGLIDILYPNKAYLHWNGQKYIHNYDENKAEEEKGYDIRYIKYKDLGKKQYNYDSEMVKFQDVDNNDSPFHFCNDETDSIKYKSRNGKRVYNITNGQERECEYIWSSSIPHQDIYENKYLYNRWLTNIILSVIVAACSLGMSLFGFLLFTN